MKYVPSLSPPITVPGDRLRANALARVRPAKPVQARTVPPLVTHPLRQHETSQEQIQHEERRHAEPLQEERRAYCRRVSHQPVMEELRSAIERRRHKQRGADSTEHIDEEV